MAARIGIRQSPIMEIFSPGYSHENHIGIENGAQVVVLPNAASRRLLRPGDFHRLRLWPNVAS